jgi:arylmalonate decarboxylase
VGKNVTIGLVSPHSNDNIPADGPGLYPDMKFIAKGVGVKSLTPEGYESAWNSIVPAAEHLAKQGVDAIMVIGASLTFYRGHDEHEALLEKLRAVTGVPVNTMSGAMRDALRSVGAKKVAVCTAYTSDINARLRDFLAASDFDVLAVEGFGLEGFLAPAEKSDKDIIELADRVHAKTPGAEALLISCGGLRTLEAGKAVEDKRGVPVVSSTEAGYWAAMRLVGESGRAPGHGRLLEARDSASSR